MRGVTIQFFCNIYMIYIQVSCFLCSWRCEDCHNPCNVKWGFNLSYFIGSWSTTSELWAVRLWAFQSQWALSSLWQNWLSNSHTLKKANFEALLLLPAPWLFWSHAPCSLAILTPFSPLPKTPLQSLNFVCRWYFTSVQRTDKLSISFKVKNVLQLCWI